jgi:hypothetical protein
LTSKEANFFRFMYKKRIFVSVVAAAAAGGGMIYVVL